MEGRAGAYGVAEEASTRDFIGCFQRGLWKRSPRPSAWVYAGFLTLYQTASVE